MDNYNIYRYNRLKQFYRFYLGLHQLINYPLLNMLWLVFGMGSWFFVHGIQRLVEMLNVHTILAPVFHSCMQFLTVFFPLLCGIGVVQLIGYVTAVKDEADMNLVFGDKRDIKNQSPILIYKKTIRKKGVTIREFYSAIPMERWQEKKESISDRLNVHIIGEIEYGGKNNNKGNRIMIKSAKGRKSIKRGVLYDDTF